MTPSWSLSKLFLPSPKNESVIYYFWASVFVFDSFCRICQKEGQMSQTGCESGMLLYGVCSRPLQTHAKISGFTFMFTSWPLASLPVESLWRLQLRRHDNYQIYPRTVYCLFPPTTPIVHTRSSVEETISLWIASPGASFFSLTYSLSVSVCFLDSFSPVPVESWGWVRNPHCCGPFETLYGILAYTNNLPVNKKWKYSSSMLYATLMSIW